jgi:hypothetical protein
MGLGFLGLRAILCHSFVTCGKDSAVARTNPHRRRHR